MFASDYLQRKRALVAEDLFVKGLLRAGNRDAVCMTNAIRKSLKNKEKALLLSQHGDLIEKHEF